MKDGASDANMPKTELDNSEFTDGKISITDLLVKSKLAPSKGEARRLIDQGGISVDDEKISSVTETFEISRFSGDGKEKKKGKKVFHKVVIK